MNRIEVSSSYIGPSNYTLDLNPSVYDPTDETDIVEHYCIKNENLYQLLVHDFRKRSLFWYNIPVGNQYNDKIVNYFHSVEGKIRYFKFQDIDSLNDGWPNSDTWKKVRIVELKVKYKPGGKLVYESIELVIQPEL